MKKKNFLNQKHKKKHQKAHKKSSPEICEKMRKKYTYCLNKYFFWFKKNFNIFCFFFLIQNIPICSKRVVRPDHEIHRRGTLGSKTTELSQDLPQKPTFVDFS